MRIEKSTVSPTISTYFTMPNSERLILPVPLKRAYTAPAGALGLRSVTDRQPGAAAGARYARFRAAGSLKRSEFGMVKFIDMVGDTVDFSIRTDAWR